MFAAKRLLQKAIHHHHHQHNLGHGSLTVADLDIQIGVHYGIPSTASLLAFDPIQRLLAVGTLDGRIKVIGGDGIEGLLMSPKQLPFKNIEFMQNQGFLVSISIENDIQVWNLESRCLACCLHWESNITAFSVISGSYFMYIGDENGSMSVVKYDTEDLKLLLLPYHISEKSLYELAGFSPSEHQIVVGILLQPCSSGNRVLIAYENGLIILWDIYGSKIIFVGGGKDLRLKDENVGSQSVVDTNLLDSTNHMQEKEISTLCWASSNGSILAVGYVDGDILFWKTSAAPSARGQQNELSSSNVVKLQLSSAEKKLPVIVIHWFQSNRTSNDCDGQLFIYGGDETGSEEVVTVLSLEWSSKMETVKCAARVDLTIAGSFADMILLPSPGPTGGNQKAALLVLTNPGKLHLYDDANLSTLLSQQEKKTSVCAMECPVVVPLVEPPMTVTKLTALPMGENPSKILSEISSNKKHSHMPGQAGGTKWPLTGGVPSQLSLTEHAAVERVYIAGYQDGSVRLWNATYPVLSLMSVLDGMVQGEGVVGFGAPVSSLDICFLTLSLAVGNERGLVCIYNLNGSSDETNFLFVTETEREVRPLLQGKGPQCTAVFSLLNSPIHALQFSNSGAKLAVGFECGRAAVLHVSSLSVLFFTDCISGSNSPVISVTWKESTNAYSLVRNPKHSETDAIVKPTQEIMFSLSKDATLNVIDGSCGSMISPHPWHPKKKSTAISMYVMECIASVSESTHGTLLEESGQSSKNDSTDTSTSTNISSESSELHSPSGVTVNEERSMDTFILLCCKDSLRLYQMKDVIQGNKKTICKVKHTKSCCWTSTFKKNDKIYGVVLLFQTGEIEIRSFPDLKLVKVSSLMSILRWNLKANMEKTISSSHSGQIALANGCEMAFISILSDENCFSVESFPCLHDKVLAAAADAAFMFSSNQKKKQNTKSGILGGIVKGFRGGKVDHTADIASTSGSDFTQLERVFLKSPLPDLSSTVTDSQEVEELDIDDIEIDDPPLPTQTTSSQEAKNIKREKGTEREQLLGATNNMQPRVRTPEEIIAAYRKAGDASSVAGQARNKLLERQEKLERISRRTAELQSGAEDFASLANELVKKREQIAKLFGSADVIRTKVLNPDEIKANYRKAKDVSSATAYARDKLAERQQKLQRISRNSEEMKSESKNYATIATELAKKMETRKWWQP